MHISGSTKLTGLFGYPVKHTVSPAMHNAGFSFLGLDLIYLPFSISSESLERAVKNLPVFGFIGINVTVPHKQTVMRYLDKISREAVIIGAVNTVKVEKGKLIGFNTDGYGFVKSLGEKYLKNKTIFLLGAGGAGYAVGVQSALSGIKRIFVADKISKRAKSLADRVPGNKAVAVSAGGSIKDYLDKADIIVNATPVGLNAGDPVPMPYDLIPRNRLVYDLIYNPVSTKLLKTAKAKGCKIINGRDMLLYQGIKSFEIWTGRKAPVGVMRKALNKEINVVR